MCHLQPAIHPLRHTHTHIHTLLQLRVYSIASSADPLTSKAAHKTRKTAPAHSSTTATSTHLAAQIAAVPGMPTAIPTSGPSASPPSAATQMLACISRQSLRSEQGAQQQGDAQGTLHAPHTEVLPVREPSACAWVCSERTPHHLTTSDSASSSTPGMGCGVLDSFLQLGQVFLPAGSLDDIEKSAASVGECSKWVQMYCSAAPALGKVFLMAGSLNGPVQSAVGAGQDSF